MRTPSGVRGEVWKGGEGFTPWKTARGFFRFCKQLHRYDTPTRLEMLAQIRFSLFDKIVKLIYKRIR